MHVDAGCRPPLSGRRLRGGSDFLASPSMREWSALPARPAAARCKPRLRRAAPFHFAPAGAARRFSRPLRSLSPPTPASGEAMGLLGSAGGNRWFSPSNRHFGLDCQDMSPSLGPRSSAPPSASSSTTARTMRPTHQHEAATGDGHQRECADACAASVLLAIPANRKGERIGDGETDDTGGCLPP